MNKNITKDQITLNKRSINVTVRTLREPCQNVLRTVRWDTSNKKSKKSLKCVKIKTLYNTE